MSSRTTIENAGLLQKPAPSRKEKGRPFRLKRRADFLAVTKKGKKQVKAGFVLYAHAATHPPQSDRIRVGFTCSKKIGNAVMRNRAKRRLRALADECLPNLGRNGWDYVLIGRFSTSASLPFQQMQSDFCNALKEIHQKAPEKQKKTQQGKTP